MMALLIALALQAPATVDWTVRAHVDLASGEAFEVATREQRAIEAG